MDHADTYVSERQGGGGVGNPFERAIESVREYVLNEFNTRRD